MFKRLRNRLSQDSEDRRVQGIRTWVESLPGVTLIETAEPRSVAKLAGVVETVRVRPRDGVQSFEAVLSDGTGSATAVWLGRRSIPGLTIGSKILVEGRVGGTPGKLLVMNPTYELAPQEL